MIDVYEAATPTVDGVDVAANLLTAHVVHLKRFGFHGNAVDDTRSCVLCSPPRYGNKKLAQRKSSWPCLAGAWKELIAGIAGKLIAQDRFLNVYVS